MRRRCSLLASGDCHIDTAGGALKMAGTDGPIDGAVPLSAISKAFAALRLPMSPVATFWPLAQVARKARKSAKVRSLPSNCRLNATASRSLLNSAHMVTVPRSRSNMRLEGEHPWQSSHARTLAISAHKPADRGTLTMMVRMTIPPSRMSVSV